MNAVKKITEDAYFVVDTLGYQNHITPFDVTLAMQTIAAGVREDVLLPEPTPVERPDPHEAV